MVVNGHSDILADVSERRKKGEKNIFRKQHYDNFRESNVKTAMFVIWTEPENEHRTSERTKEIIGYMEDEFKESKDIINHCKNYSDLLKAEEEQVNVILNFEGLAHIGDRLDLIKYYKENLGIFYSSLTWNEKNLLASGAPHQGGLTELGKKAVEVLEENNVIIDMAHINEESFWDIAKIAKKPFIASHSNARNLCDVKRNLWDDQLEEIAKSGGLIGMNAYADFVSKDRNKRNIDGLIDHIDYIKGLVGIDHITFGFDFCDFLPSSYLGDIEESTTVKGLVSEKDIKNLILRLGERGYSKEEIELISYKNYYKFLKEHFK